MDTKNIRWIADPGHAWLRVPLDTCTGLEISLYSYEHKGYAYLECDCDAPLWWAAHGGKSEDIPVTFIDGDWEGRDNYRRFPQTVRS